MDPLTPDCRVRAKVTKKEAKMLEKKTPRETVNLNGVPETLLWPLWNRGMERRQKAPLIDDPISAELLDRIEYDFRGSFGEPNAGHPIRARVIDDAIREWLLDHPQGTIISLGEGLDSQFWRVDNGTLNWISVDLPESIALREQLLPQERRIRMISSSALDPAWMELAPKRETVFIVMAGLLMYFTEAEVGDLLRRVGDRFPGSHIFFDLIPQWFSRKTVKGMYVTKRYKAPIMPWGLNYGEYRKLLSIHPGLRLHRRMTYAELFPGRMRPYSYLVKIPWIKNNLAPWMVHLRVEVVD